MSFSLAHTEGSTSTPDQRTGQGLTRPTPTYFGGLHRSVVDSPRSDHSWSDLEAQKPLASIYPGVTDVSPPKPLWRKRCERVAAAFFFMLLGAGIFCLAYYAT